MQGLTFHTACQENNQAIKLWRGIDQGKGKKPFSKL